MTEIHAALVEILGEPPRFRSLPAPQASAGKELVQVIAVGLHPLTRGIAAGRHYVSADRLPFVAGADAIVRRSDGSLAFIGAPHSGTLAEQLVIDPRAAIPMPDADPAVLAATLNPLMSSWMALRTRVPFEAGQSVLVIGATGNAGSMAVKVARRLGAGRVVAAGRNESRLAALGADATVTLAEDLSATSAALAAEAADVDVVLDYVWGTTTELAMEAVVRARSDDARLLDWVQLGSVGGPSITLPAAALRSSAIRLSGSGLGSVPFEAYVRELPEAARAIVDGGLVVLPRTRPLSDITAAWAHADTPGERTVIMPQER